MSITTEDVHATVAATAELGREYDDALTDSLLDRFAVRARQRRSDRTAAILHDAVTVTIALGSMGLGVLFVASTDGLGAFGATVATIVAWVGIAVVNVAYARARHR